MIFTFWEGKMPPYIQMCLDTWGFEYTLLNYDNLHLYTDAEARGLEQRFVFSQVADFVRAHVLRDTGGYWLDADTIMLNDKLPIYNMIGDPDTRMITIGYLHTEPNTDMYIKWTEYQSAVVADTSIPNNWDLLGNAFLDKYVIEHPEVTIGSVRKCWPETYMIGSDIPRRLKYETFYFSRQYHLADIENTDMLMLHNAWTPDWYKNLSTEETLKSNCTLSNILRERG